MSFDKRKGCKDAKTGEHCPDRKVGCHDTCEGYQFRHEENMERLRKEKETRWKPTAHHDKVVIDYYKRQKKNYAFYRGKKK